MQHHYHEHVDSLAWIDSLPQELEAQKDILRRLLAMVESDLRWRWLQLGCSVAGGRGDSLSDLDLGIGVAGQQWESSLNDLSALLENLWPVAGALYHRLPQFGDRQHLRAFIQYANGVQVDLVAVPAGIGRNRKPEDIMLYDPDRALSETWDDSVLSPTGETVYEWTFLAWIALADLAKYLHRGSAWEASERLQEARTQVWRLWAVAKGLRYPSFRLTEVLDHPEAGIPPGIEETVCSLNIVAIHAAASVCAQLLCQISAEAARATGANLPHAFADFVKNRLDQSAPASPAS